MMSFTFRRPCSASVSDFLANYVKNIPFYFNYTIQ